MKLRLAVLLGSVALLALLSGCREKKDTTDQPPTTTSTTTADPKSGPGPSKEPITAETIAHAGHAKLFDKHLKEIPGDPKTLMALQEALLSEISKHDGVRKIQQNDETIAQAQKLLATQLPEEQAFAIKAGIIEKSLQNVPELEVRYGWRNRAILSHHWNLDRKLRTALSERILELLRDLGVFRPVTRTTDYIRDCQAHDVPIPPDWAETGTAWVMQGTLARNLLSPGNFAAVWTYSDPAKRGACIALPRGDGSPGSPAGIICQSATTGHACFWDNKLLSVSPEEFMGWSGLTLRIADLKDGSNLNSSCTGCHIGNNVYLISPDDPTWGKVLRGPLSGARTGTFTTVVEASSDNRGGHPRYVPITTLPERPGWQNNFPGPGCAGSCHEQPVATFGPPPMPPACAAGGVSNCYGTP
jgi:hypothetical protein